ncbi:BTAD domain-containing putative transcriptional regulator [Actinomadura sp. WAC 06369]|uniref:BTAD domain-containing putative transcriptional regulator n=1 Tax=Actinomadura sp. WAC 06369 TaxID=2203193 RepID=UPI000F7B6E58|nr:BTAD domain-containing putative transcriptional regulator [Actinomadura sp. WAC 06369]RSN56828.1 AfsR family transcriptional regulator [Actinomadura sp. WAC 06369]
MRFGVLGPLEVRTADGRLVRVRETRVRALLADLLARRGHVVSADRLLDDLWGDAPPAGGVRTVRSKVSLLRRVLEEAEPGGRGLLVSRPPGYLLQVADDAVDAGRFEELLRRARTAGDPGARARLLAEALGTWRGTAAFADFADAAFVRGEAARLEERRLAALEDLAEARLELGEHGAAAGDLAEAVAAHPFRERLRTLHALALYRAGRQGDALASLGDLRDRLRDELGLDPGPGASGLYEAILRRDPALLPAAAPAPRPRGDLPVPPTGLVGREGEVRRVGELLDSARLVTLTGPGGVGKTRLALEVAARRAGDFPDGVRLVELAEARTGAEAGEAVAASLELRDAARAGARPPAERIADAVAGRRMLLVLDNCEHVVEPVAALAARLLRAAPDVRLLATGREPLAIGGERLWPVPPLDLPEPDAAGPERSSAVRLFVERATAAAPGFALGPGNAAAVAAICRRLDGIPLALELAATRVRVLDVHDLAARLDDRFRVLTAGVRDAPARQRTLRAVIDWSWGLLTDAERVVLRRLAVCAGGCTLETAEAVCADGTDGGVRAADVLDLLGRLVDRSLVVHRDGRYRLLESVAAYANERLAESGEREAVRERHLARLLEFAERAEPRLRGHRQREWLDRLDAEAAGLRAALEHAVRRGPGDPALRLVNALGWYWFLRGRFAEARRSFDLALTAGGAAHLRAAARMWRAGISLLLPDGLAAPPRSTGEPAGPAEHAAAESDPPGVARARWFLALSRVGFGDARATLGLADRALARFRAHGDRWGAAAARTVRAEVLAGLGEPDRARGDAEGALAVFRELGDRWGESRAACVLADLAEFAGDYATAGRLRREALGRAEELRLWNDAADTLARLGRTALLTGDLESAEDLHRRAGRLAAAHSYRRGEEFAETGLGMVARRRGRLDEAEARLRRWLDWCRRWEGDLGTAFILAELGFIAELRGAAAEALALHREGLRYARRTGDPRALARGLEGLAGAHVLDGRAAEAVRLLGEAAAARESVGLPLPPAERGDVDRIAAAARRALDPAGGAAAEPGVSPCGGPR